jgi:ABC-type Mn2+/Zn2+ transport system ATPase subunit
MNDQTNSPHHRSRSMIYGSLPQAARVVCIDLTVPGAVWWNIGPNGAEVNVHQGHHGLLTSPVGKYSQAAASVSRVGYVPSGNRDWDFPVSDGRRLMGRYGRSAAQRPTKQDRGVASVLKRLRCFRLRTGR